MSLATSCPACGTVFRVAEDQLKVSEGWVRCGHCHQVFNALEGLFDLDGRQRPAAAGAYASVARSGRPLAGGHAAVERMATTHRPAAARPETVGSGGSAGAVEAPPVPPAPTASVAPGASPALAVSPPPALPPAADEPGPGDTSSSFDAPGPDCLDPVPALGVSAIAANASAEPEAAPERTSRPDPVEQAWNRDADWTAPFHAPAPGAELQEVASVRGLAREDETEADVDLSMADTVFLPHEPSRFHDDEASAAPLPPVDEDTGWEAEHAAAPDREALSRTFVESAQVASLPAPMDALAESAHGAQPVLPAFVRDADRAAWWRRPAVQFALAAACVLSGLALVLQWAAHDRDRLAARWPVLRAPLASLCDAVGCQVAAPRQLEALVVENSSLVRQPGNDAFRLQVLLRNRAIHVVRSPHLELTLTDGTGAVVVRRVLAPADFQQGAELAPGVESNWQLEMGSDDKRIAGFTVTAFYP